MLKFLFVVLKRKKYALIAGLTAVIFFALSYYLTVATISGKSIVIYAQMSGFGFTVFSLALSLVISLLMGFYMALLIFKKNIAKIKSLGNKTASAGGAVSGLLAAGCPSCGAPLLAYFGFPLALYFLPFKGLEIKILSIIFLLLAVYLIVRSIKKNLTCEINS